MRLRFVLASLVLAVPAAATETRVVQGARIELGELVSEAPEAVRNLDLGPAPPPGSSRLFGQAELSRAIRRAGYASSSVAIPKSIRAVSASQQLNVDELSKMGRRTLESVLPAGVTVEHVSAHRAVEVAPDVVMKAPELPRMPRRAGPFRTSLIFPLAVDGVITDRVPMSVVFRLSQAAAQADAPRGARVSLVIERSSAVISAAGIALRDTDVGDVATFRIEKTGRVVKAQLESARRARILEAQ